MPRQIDVDRLFDTTATVFAERGYQAATTLEIAKRSDVNEVTIFRRYGGKAALINAALSHVLSRSPFARLTVGDDVEADLGAMVRAYAETARQYGGAVLTLLTEVPRHPELRAAMSALEPNLRNAVEVVAVHQERGRLAQGDPMRMMTTLIAPLMVSELWPRAGIAAAAGDLDPGAVVAAFLDGHRAG